jgi:tetratricopeptide (TPR) repeat protein
MRSLDSFHDSSRRLAFLLLAAVPVLGCDPGEPEAAELDPELGSVELPTSCSEEAQAHLDRGLAFLHHMMYVRAEDAFSEATEVEEDCAMAHWGVAMTQFQPLWPGEPGPEALEKGRAAAERALELDPPTERERAYARAAVAFFEAPHIPFAERISRWELGMAALHDAFPEDPEAATLYALAHLAVDPSDPVRQDRAAAILEAVHDEMARHPGAVHYAIHVHDVDERAEDGAPFARAYEELAPSVPHALHMPSHIYVRLGEWDEVIEWNRRSADAALGHPAGDYTSHHYPHALDYLMYGYLQRGEDARAREVLEELRTRDDYQPTFISAYALAAVPARWYVERRDWAGAAELELEPAVFRWETFPGAEAMTHFARGLGAARTGDAAGARASIERLEELEAMETAAENHYWARQIEVQRRSVSAWATLAEGDREAAVLEMTAAAGLEAQMEKHPVTPGALQPAYELLGDLLLEADRPAEALAAYEQSLETWPRRYHSLLGAARAADGVEDDAAAARYYGELAQLTADADPDREGVAEARERTGL